MNLFIVRHGTSEGNINKAKYFEKLDSEIELADKGVVDAVGAADKIIDISNIIRDKTLYPTLEKNPVYYNMFCSSYARAKQTNSIICNRVNGHNGHYISNIIETPLCREREWGGLRDIVELGKKTEDHFNFFYRPTGGESFADCFHRVATFHQWLVNNTKYNNNIVVAHGEFNKLYLMYLLNWTIEEFDKWKNPRNGEVFFVRDGELSSLTPLTLNNRNKK